MDSYQGPSLETEDSDDDPFLTKNLSVGARMFNSAFRIDDIGPTKIREGTLIMGKYKLGPELAVGGYGAVYLCDSHPDKVIKVEVAERSPEQFFNEVQI